MITPPIVKDNIPVSAITVSYKVKGIQMSYSVWPSKRVFSGPGLPWYEWSAAGNNGTEPSKEQAETRARRWLRDGQ